MLITKITSYYKYKTVPDATVYIVVCVCVYIRIYKSIYMQSLECTLLSITHLHISNLPCRKCINSFMYLTCVVQAVSSGNCFPDRVLLCDETCGKGLKHPSVRDQHTLGVASPSDLWATSKTQQAGDILQDVPATHQSDSAWCPKALWRDDWRPRADRSSNPPTKVQNWLDWEDWYHRSRYDFIVWYHTATNCLL